MSGKKSKRTELRSKQYFASLGDRYARNVRMNFLHGCWEWIGVRNYKGYGAIKHEGKTMLAHRVAYELHWGKIHSGLHVLHSCDNPWCVNPMHLRLGTHADNMADKVSKGRQSMAGRPSWNRKLSDADVIGILESCGKFKDIGEKYGVSATTVCEIKSGRKWSALTGVKYERGEKKAYGAQQ